VSPQILGGKESREGDNVGGDINTRVCGRERLKQKPRTRTLGATNLTAVEVEVFTEMHRVGILVQEPTVGGLEEVVKIVLRTAEGPAHASSVTDVHALLPAVVKAKGQEETTTVGRERIREVLGTGPDVVTDILAVSARGVTTLVVSQLHETLFASTTDGVRIAATFLESDRSQEDVRKSEFVTKLLEGPNEILAGSEGTAMRDGVIEVNGNELIDADEGRVPARALDTAVQPVNGSVGASGPSDMFGSTVGSAPVILDPNETARVWSGVVLGFVLLWFVLWFILLGFVLLGLIAGIIVVVRVGTIGRALPASTAIIGTARKAVVVGTMDVAVVQDSGFDEDGERGEENEG